MATERIHLSDCEAEINRQSIEAGDFEEPGDVIRAGLLLLAERQVSDRATLEALRAEIQKGVDAYEAGEYMELNTPEDITALCEDVKRRGRERLAKEANAPSAG